MAKNREMLKEAIAEAKAVKEAAIANAKAALEEAFTPQLKSMLSLKLQEMELDEEENEKEGFGDFDTKDNASFGKMGAKALDEDEDKMMEVDLEELLAELELEEGEDDTLNEAEEEGEEEGEEEEGEEEGDMEMEDLSDDEIKEMIEDVIAQMIKDGELEAGPEFEGEEEGEEMEMGAEEEEEVDLAELLREIEEMEEKEEEKEETNEVFGKLKKFFTGDPEKELIKFLKDNGVQNAEEVSTQISSASSPQEKTNILKTALGPEKYSQPKVGSSGDISNFRYALGMMTPEEKKKKEAGQGFGTHTFGSGTGTTNEAEEMKKELEEAYKTINTLRSELNEINLLNAKLLYSNKIFKAKNLNENQKVKVLSSFDKAKNVGEVKMVYETLNEGIKVAKTTIKENLGRASKSTVTPTTKQPIVESNDVFKRMQKLAGII